jgi:hypothetical protein
MGRLKVGFAFTATLEGIVGMPQEKHENTNIAKTAKLAAVFLIWETPYHN